LVRHCSGIAAGSLATVEIVDIEPAARTEMGVIYKQGRYLTLAARSFLEELWRFSFESPA
jgi:hypothetical protein